MQEQPFAYKKSEIRRVRKPREESIEPTNCCLFCRTEDPVEYKSWYENFIICLPCSAKAFRGLAIDDLDETVTIPEKLVTDYSEEAYFTRYVATQVDQEEVAPKENLGITCKPADNQLYSLSFDSTYYDIPGRAPRWSTHSGEDYHGIAR